MPNPFGAGNVNRLPQRRVLVVEDEALVSMLVEDELRDAGADVLGPAATLHEAIRLAEAALADGGLDAAVLDANLGGEPVLPLADWLRERGVPFVFATGYGDGLERGRHDSAPIVAKPFDTGALIRALQTALERR